MKNTTSSLSPNHYTLSIALTEDLYLWEITVGEMVSPNLSDWLPISPQIVNNFHLVHGQYSAYCFLWIYARDTHVHPHNFRVQTRDLYSNDQKFWTIGPAETIYELFLNGFALIQSRFNPKFLKRIRDGSCLLELCLQSWYNLCFSSWLILPWMMISLAHYALYFQAEHHIPPNYFL